MMDQPRILKGFGAYEIDLSSLERAERLYAAACRVVELWDLGTAPASAWAEAKDALRSVIEEGR